DRAAVLLVLPVAHEQLGEVGADPLPAVGDHALHLLARVEGPSDRGDEQPGLRAEEVDHERGVDAGVAGDPAQRRRAVPACGERAAGGVEDRLARLGLPGPAPAARGSRLTRAHAAELDTRNSTCKVNA